MPVRAPRRSAGPAAPAAGAAGTAETHISVLFFYGDRVVKVRKAVDFGFVRFADIERRRTDCEREVALNRRLAPDVYLGTATITMEGRPVEHAVVMRRLPQDRNLAELVRRGRHVATELRRVAGVLADFHRRAARSPAIGDAATATALWQRWQATENDLAPFIGSAVDVAAYRDLTALADRYLRGRAPLLDRRVADGAVCDGHGDLQASDIFCLPDGPRILDCLEFDDQLRYGDALADAAFLAADLERLGASDAATVFLEEYGRRSGLEAPPSLLHFYLAARLHVRLLVTCLQAAQGITGDATEARRLLDLALAHLRQGRVRLVLVGGLPGTGKSTLAAWVAEQLGAVLLSSDRVRRELEADRLRQRGKAGRRRGGAGPPPTDAAAPDPYGTEARASVYRELCERAARLTAMGRSVVLDATWTSAAMRRQAAAAAHGTHAELSELRCTCGPSLQSRRIAARRSAGPVESDATTAVAEEMARHQDDWSSAVTIDTSGTRAATRRLAAGALGLTPARASHAHPAASRRARDQGPWSRAEPGASLGR